MNQPGDDLFLLIKSLTASEKRYFKLFAQRQGNEKSKSYIRIFEIMDVQGKIYDEAELKSKLKTKADIKTLPQMKIYLHEMIMKSMRLFRSDKNIVAEVFDLIQDELFYTEKGLIGLRAKTMKRAKELGYKHDIMYLLVAVLQRERIYALKYTGGDPLEKIEEIHTEEKYVIERLNNESELGRIAFQLWAQFLIDPLLNDPEILSEFNSFKEHPLLKDYKQMKTFMEKMSYLRAHGFICRFNNDFQGLFNYNKKIVELYIEYPQHEFNVGSSYVDALNNYLSASHKVGNYDEFELIIEKLNSLSKEKVKDETSIALSVIQNKLLYVMNTGKFDRSDELLVEFDEVSRKFHKLIPDSFYIVANYNICIILFIKNEWEKALDHCKKIIDFKSEARQELQHGAMMLQLILNFELNNLQLLDSLCRNVVRSLQVEDRYNSFEKMFCSYIKKLLKTPVSELGPVYLEMFDAALSLKKQQNDRVNVLMTETLAWCRSKIDKTPVKETIFNSYV